MRDEARLKQLIEETKTKKLEAFRSGLEEDLSQELCDLLELTYTIAQPEGQPKASFRMQSETWEILPARVLHLEHSSSQMSTPTRWLVVVHTDTSNFHRPPELRGFDSKDDLLLLLDKSMQDTAR